ncbi:MAG: AbrB/MazE/SpoVT family DNA-binding domain-containing protein [Candidatus Omnitrophica bacterium]|nr:AbrB/MazE/SpoVT family DNA-binding domain-containing protein [Candidatus Omnitrophota bacterium]
MVTFAPKSIKVWGSGQLTIPKEMREALNLSKETKLNVFTVGRCLIMTPKILLRRSLAKKLQKEMKEKKISLNDLLKDLKAERRLYNQ